MKSVPGVWEKLKREYETRRQSALEKAEIRQKKLHAEIPEIKQIDERLSNTGLLIMDEIMKGKNDLENRLKVLEVENNALLKKRASLLTIAGLPVNYTDPQFKCPVCEDRGYKNAKMCDCMKSEYAIEALSASGLGTLAKKQSFDNYRVEIFAPEFRENAKNALETCRRYAEEFKDSGNDNLLLAGTTGLGKTHLSTAIAKRVIEKGYYVVYVSVQTMISDFSSLRFGEGAEGENAKTAKYFEADLLIIDDLGTEIPSNYALSVIYNVINTRICRDKAMIVSTNFTSSELKEVYSDRITSRLFGNFSPLRFLGKDNRMTIKKLNLDE